MEIAFFDVDHTLLPHDSLELLLVKKLMKKRLIPISNIVRSLVFLLKNVRDFGNTALRRNKEYIVGLGETVAQSLAKEIAQDFPRIVSPDGIAEIKKLQAVGTRIVLLSASAQFLVGELARFLKADEAIGAQFEFVGGEATGKLLGTHPLYFGKVTNALEYAAKNKIVLADCGAYANATSDIPLLSMVSRACAVNPDNALRVRALERGWQIMSFSRLS